jgi:hypothetical protein
MIQSAQQAFVKAFPHAEIATLAGLNHLLQMRNSLRVAEPVADFLRRHPM